MILGSDLGSGTWSVRAVVPPLPGGLTADAESVSDLGPGVAVLAEADGGGPGGFLDLDAELDEGFDVFGVNEYGKVVDLGPQAL
jgi:hypothetical protein